jgi:hypothetical protein
MNHAIRYYEHSHICSTLLKIILACQKHKFTNQEMSSELSIMTRAALRGSVADLKNTQFRAHLARHEIFKNRQKSLFLLAITIAGFRVQLHHALL